AFPRRLHVPVGGRRPDTQVRVSGPRSDPCLHRRTFRGRTPSFGRVTPRDGATRREDAPGGASGRRRSGDRRAGRGDGLFRRRVHGRTLGGLLTRRGSRALQTADKWHIAAKRSAVSKSGATGLEPALYPRDPVPNAAAK